MRGLTEEAAAVAIDVATRVLHLPTVRTSADELAAAAVRDRVTHRAYLAELLSAEVDDREGRRRERRVAEARFPRTKRLAEFDLGATPSIEPAVLAALAAGAWIEAGEPVNQNIFEMSAREKKRLKIDVLPGSLAEALDCLEKDDLLKNALGEHIYDKFVEAKRTEWHQYIAQVHGWEVDRYLQAY